MDEIRFAVRSLLRRPALMAVSVVTLSVGIAANGIMFGVVDQLLLRSAPGLVNPDQLRRVYYDYHREGGQPSSVTTYPIIAAIEHNAPGIETATFVSPAEFTLGGGADARPIKVQLVSGNFLPMLGVRPVTGRWFLPDEARIPVGDPVAVIAAGFWRRELGAAPDAVGRVLAINGRQFRVVGIAPDGFTGVDRSSVDVWLPISAVGAERMGEHWYDQPNSFWVQAVARLKPGVDAELAEAQATTALRHEFATWDPRRGADTTANVVLGSIIGARHPAGISAESKVSLWLMGVSVLVLLIACANVANLLIARTVERRREIAVRIALGVGRARLVRMLLTESAVLAVAAGVAAIAITAAASRVVQQLLLPGIQWAAVVDLRMLAVTFGAVLLSVVLAGTAPAFAGMTTSVSENLKAGSHQAAGGRGHVRHVLLATQAALSVMLLIGAGLFTRSLRNVATRDVGVDLDRVMLVAFPFTRGSVARPMLESMHADAEARIRALPGVTNVAVIRQGVPGRSGSGMSLRVPGVTQRPRLSGGGPYYSIVPSSYFATIGTEVVRGRAFTESEDRSPSRSLIINRIVADAYWPGQDPLGQCAYMGSDSTCSTVVGITETAFLFALIRDDRGLLYIPVAHASFGDRPPAALIVRAAGVSRALVPAIRRIVQGLSPDMPYATVQPYAQEVAWQLQPWRLGAAMFTAFGLIALLIAAIGLYSVMAYSVSQRTREIGVRMALGAQPWDVVRLVAWQSSRATAVGLLCGAAIALVASRWVTDMLYETSPRDPFIYAGAAVVLALAAVIASVVPARRSSAVDPALALRSD